VNYYDKEKLTDPSGRVQYCFYLERLELCLNKSSKRKNPQEEVTQTSSGTQSEDDLVQLASFLDSVKKSAQQYPSPLNEVKEKKEKGSNEEEEEES
jgi:hypothetical protein